MSIKSRQDLDSTGLILKYKLFLYLCQVLKALCRVLTGIPCPCWLFLLRHIMAFSQRHPSIKRPYDYQEISIQWKHPLGMAACILSSRNSIVQNKILPDELQEVAITEWAWENPICCNHLQLECPPSALCSFNCASHNHLGKWLSSIVLQGTVFQHSIIISVWTGFFQFLSEIALILPIYS